MTTPTERTPVTIELICPRCGSGTPDCTTSGHTHADTCAKDRYTADVCDDCKGEPRPPVIVRYETTYSVYEIDHTGPGFRVRRVSGRLSPTPRQGKDGEWKDAVAIEKGPDDSLRFQWSADPDDATITSPVVRTYVPDNEPAEAPA